MRFKLTFALSFALAVVLTGPPAATASVGLTTTFGSVTPTPGAKTVPYFRDSFTYGGTTYPYTMVGTNPRTSSATTTVPVAIIPLRLVFPDGTVSDPGTTANEVAASPIFQDASFTSGTTQYGDAMQRASFWQYTSSTSWHVRLGQPTILPTQTLNVPKGEGVYLQAGDPVGPPPLGVHTAAPTGVVSIPWFEGGVTSNSSKTYELGGALGQLLNRLKLDPGVLPIFVDRNVFLSDKPIPYGLPLLGNHTATSSRLGNGGQQVQTMIWADYAVPYTTAEFPSITQNTDILSHEVSEWLADPFASNIVPAWQSPLPLANLFYGCQRFLETGDPVVDAGFDVNGYQLQDEAFLSWFAHLSPSIGINGQYTYLGTFDSPSPSC
jgi:hypothetical protein